jgi:hypothetical protein
VLIDAQGPADIRRLSGNYPAIQQRMMHGYRARKRHDAAGCCTIAAAARHLRQSRAKPAVRPARNAAVEMTAYSGLKFIATPLMQ